MIVSQNRRGGALQHRISMILAYRVELRREILHGMRNDPRLGTGWLQRLKLPKPAFDCPLCGQHITDGKPCSCGAR
jgi:hypothetical protein